METKEKTAEETKEGTFKKTVRLKAPFVAASGFTAIALIVVFVWLAPLFRPTLPASNPATTAKTKTAEVVTPPIETTAALSYTQPVFTPTAIPTNTALPPTNTPTNPPTITPT